MTEERILELVAHWQAFLGLGNWEIEVDFAQEAGEEAYARAWRSNSYDRATINLDRGWQEWEPGFANRIIAHELLHLVARDLEQSVTAVKEHVPRFIWELLAERIDHEMEGLIDRLSVMFVDLAAS